MGHSSVRICLTGPFGRIGQAFLDGHSTSLHFFQTLPPEIALEYIKRSPRADAVATVSDEESLYRWGQGASYHEFELWMADAAGKLPGILADG